MTPEQIAALTAIATILSKVGTWPIGSIIAAVVFGPWIVMGLVSRSMEKRHEAAMKMYESNVSLCRDFSSVSHDLREIVVLNVQQMTQMNDAIRQNQYCPVVRIDKKQITIGERIERMP